MKCFIIGINGRTAVHNLERRKEEEEKNLLDICNDIEHFFGDLTTGGHSSFHRAGLVKHGLQKSLEIN